MIHAAMGVFIVMPPAVNERDHHVFKNLYYVILIGCVPGLR